MESESAATPEQGEQQEHVAPLQRQPSIVDGQQTILLALDASDQAEHAVNWYVSHIHRPGNRLVFIHCIELPEMKLNQAMYRRGSLHMSPGVLASMWKEEETKTKDLEEKMKKILKERALVGVLRTATGKPGEVICRIVEEENAAMVVVGSRGVGKVRRTILGSVSDYLVNHSRVPVIVCRHPSTFKQRRHSSVDGGRKSRHASGDSIKSRNASGDSVKSRHASGDNNTRSRRFSGDCVFKTTSIDSGDEVYEEKRK